MKKLILSFLLLNLNTYAQASCMGPFCWDDKGAYIAGIKFPGTFGGGSGSVAGDNTEIQFNDNGSFGATPNFTWDNDNNILSVSNINTDEIDAEGDITIFSAGSVNILGTGVTFPQLNTSQRNAITNPRQGQTIVNTSSHTLEFYNGTEWRALAGTAVN